MKVRLCLWLCQRRRLKIVVVFFGVSTCVGLLCELVSDESANEATAEPQWTATGGESSAAVTHGFLPGGYLRDTLPANVSHCRYNYGAPAQLLFEAGSASRSPGGGVEGPYRVLYNVVQGDPGTSALTYCTHATPELLWHVAEVVRRWDGPVSLAVFAPLGDAALCLQLVDRLCRCSPHMSTLSLHFVFPARAPPLVPDPAVTPPPPGEDCAAPHLFAPTARRQLGLTYPVNVVRNAARTAASTQHVLVSDVELLPSRQLAAGFTALWARLGRVRLASARHVFVVPVFEVERGEEVPATKQQLVRLYARGRAVYFHRWVCLHCQRFPGLQRWLHRRPLPHLQALLVVRREFPYHRWEPVFIGTNQEPLYSEELSWEGQQDKMTQMTEMCLLGYKFVILDGAFLVHVPGVKRRSTVPPQWRHLHQRSNAQVYARIMDDLRHKYGSGGRCRL